jgi:hypothetical protein
LNVASAFSGEGDEPCEGRNEARTNKYMLPGKGITMKALMTCVMALIVGLTANSLALAGGKGGSGGSGGKGGNGGSGSKSSSYTHTSHGSSPYHGSSSISYSSYKGGNSSSKGGKNYTNSKYTNYHLTHGTKFSKGYFYSGKYHSHWSYCCFSKKFGCYLYCCPCTNCWYYYCVPDCCYYPVCYVPYSCYCWGAPVCYSAAPVPPTGVAVPEPVNVIGPTE